MALKLGNIVFEIDQVCRLCLKRQTNLNDIFLNTVENQSYGIILSSLSCLPVNKNDGLPQNICDSCKEALYSYFKFKQNIIKTYELLCDSIADFKNSIHKKQENLTIKEENDDESIEEHYEEESIEDSFEEVKDKPKRKKKDTNKSDDLLNDKYSAAFQKLLKNRDKCVLCLKKLCKGESMVEHCNSHYVASKLTPLIIDGKKTKVCNLCDKAFKYSAMVSHHRAHLKIYPFKCEIDDCEQSFITPQYLSAHMHKHTGLKKYQCKTCGKTFGLRSSLTNHEETHIHENLQCKLCNKFYKNKSILKIHMKRHVNRLSFKCDYSGCDKAFSVLRELNRHRRTHTEEKSHICDICSKAWYTIGELTRHQRYHMKIKQHKCSHCEKSFVERNQLRMHEMTHRGERPYICEFCSVSFVARNKLKRHQSKYCKGIRSTFEQQII